MNVESSEAPKGQFSKDLGEMKITFNVKKGSVWAKLKTRLQFNNHLSGPSRETNRNLVRFGTGKSNQAINLISPQGAP